jgi:putative transposase
VSDTFWELVKPIVPPRVQDPHKVYKRKPGGGRKALDPRKVFEGMVYVLRTGCQWKAIPKAQFGAGSTVHGYFVRWRDAGFFLALWVAGLNDYDEIKGIDWEWQSTDGAMTKAPLALETVGPNPTDRGKNGTKRHVVTDGRGVPLALVTTGANRHDVSQLELLLDSYVTPRPDVTADRLQHLCGDKAYDSPYCHNVMLERDFTPHIVSRGEEKVEKTRTPGHRARRWVVEASHSWMNRFRKILVRFEKTDASYFALLCISCSIIAWRQVFPIYG